MAPFYSLAPGLGKRAAMLFLTGSPGNAAAFAARFVPRPGEGA
jgi:hypothetical protein